MSKNENFLLLSLDLYIYRQLDEQFSDLTWEILQTLSDWAIFVAKYSGNISEFKRI